MGWAMSSVGLACSVGPAATGAIVGPPNGTSAASGPLPANINPPNAVDPASSNPHSSDRELPPFSRPGNNVQDIWITTSYLQFLEIIIESIPLLLTMSKPIFTYMVPVYAHVNAN